MNPSVFVFDQPMSAGERARITRLAHHLRQIDIACLARCSVADVSDFERGLPISGGVRRRLFTVLELEDDVEER